MAVCHRWNHLYSFQVLKVSFVQEGFFQNENVLGDVFGGKCPVRHFSGGKSPGGAAREELFGGEFTYNRCRNYKWFHYFSRFFSQVLTCKPKIDTYSFIYCFKPVFISTIFWHICSLKGDVSSDLLRKFHLFVQYKYRFILEDCRL